MVAIVSGARTGLELSSLAILGAPGIAGQPVEGRNKQGVYVNAATGNLVVQQQDDFLVGRGPDAAALRTYNSRGVVEGDADNWFTGVEFLGLDGAPNTAGSTITRYGRDGSAAAYAFDAATALYTSTEGSGAHDSIRYVGGAYEWRDAATGLTQRYEGSGGMRLLSSRDAAGNTLTYTYGANGLLSAVNVAGGGAMYYDYAGSNLTQVRTVSATGTTTTCVRHAYDASNRLAAVTVDLSPTDGSVADGRVYQTTYTYDGTSKRIARIVQTDGSSLSFTYVDAGAGVFMVASVTDALNRITSFNYGLRAPGLASYALITDAGGQVTRHDFDAKGQVTAITAPAVNGVTPTRQFTYTANGDVASITDEEGRATIFQYDARGNQVLQRDAAGNTITRTFDARNQILTETRYAVADPDGAGAGQASQPLTSRYVYDDRGQNLLRFEITPEGRMVEHQYDAYGQRTASIGYRTPYPVAGLGTTVLTEATVTSWKSATHPIAAQRTDLFYDPVGQLQLRITYASVDASGRGVTDGLQRMEHFVHDAAGRLLQTDSPTEGATTNTYDGLGRLLTTTDALGQATVRQYSDSAGTTVVTLASGLVSTSTFDRAGRLVSELRSSASSSNLGATRYYYDSLDRLCMTKDATGVSSFVLYDADGRKVGDIDGSGTMTEYSYDRSSLLVRTMTWGTAVTAGLMDAAGLPLHPSVAAIRPPPAASDMAVWRQYDGAGRLVRQAESVGTGTRAAVTETRYDGLSRVVQVIRYATTVLADGTAGAAAAGSVPLPLAAPDDRSTRYFHDADGLLVGTLDADGDLVAYSYTAAGKLAERLAYATATDAALRATGTLAQLRPAASGADIREVTLYDAQGNAIAQVDGEGFLTENIYDTAGNLTRTIRYAAPALTAATVTSSLASLRPARSPADRATSWTYDALNRVTQESNAEGTVTQYAYDTAGHLVSTTRAQGAIEQRTVLARYDVLERLTGELTGEGAALLTGGQTQAQIDAVWAQYGLTHTYDAVGRRTSTRDALGNTSWFYYDADGALRYTINALGEVRENRYDARGRLLQQVAYAARTGLRGPGGVLAAPLALATGAQDAVVNYSYTRDSRIASETDAEGNVATHAYNAFGDESGSTRVISPGVSLTQSYAIDHRGLRTTTISDPAGLKVSESTVYDAFGRVVRSTDGNGNVREQTHDRLGRVVTARDGMGGIGATSYDAFSRTLTQTDALGNVTHYAYNAGERSITVTTPEGIATRTVNDRHGQVQSITDGNGNTTSYTYDRDGRLTGTTTPLTATSTRHDRGGHVIETTDGNGVRTTYTYDAADRVLRRQVDPTGLNLTTTYAYDAMGRKVSVVDPNGVTTAYQYDRNGRVLKETVDPSGLDLQTTYVYDADDNVLTVTSAGGTVTQYVYDALGRRIRERLDPAGLNLTRSWAYDGNGNVKSSTDGVGAVTRYWYDAEDRLVWTVDPGGGVGENVYDAAGRIARAVAYARPVNAASVVGASAATVQSLVVPDAAHDQVEHRVYDRDGRLTYTVDGSGGVVGYGHDRNGNVTARVAFAARLALVEWTPGTPPAVLSIPAVDQRLDTVYDALNRAIYTMDGMGAVVGNLYDGNGNLVRRTQYATSLPLGTAPQAVAGSSEDRVTVNAFDAANRLVFQVDALGAVTEQSFDADGHVARRKAYAIALAAVPAAGSASTVAGIRAVAMASELDRTTRYGYDAAGREAITIDAVGAAVQTQYDGDGRVTARTASAVLVNLGAIPVNATLQQLRALVVARPGADRVTRQAYDAAGRLLYAIDGTGAVQATRYDGAGRVSSVMRYANRPALASYSAAAIASALAAVASATDQQDTFTYDAAGRRTAAGDAEGSTEIYR